MLTEKGLVNCKQAVYFVCAFSILWFSEADVEDMNPWFMCREHFNVQVDISTLQMEKKY